MADDTDWRLQGQERYLKDALVTYRKYRPSSESWDHDHCEFCLAKFMEASDDPDVKTDGYATVDGDRWICSASLADFMERFTFVIRR